MKTKLTKTITVETTKDLKELFKSNNFTAKLMLYGNSDYVIKIPPLIEGIVGIVGTEYVVNCDLPLGMVTQELAAMLGWDCSWNLEAPEIPF